MVYSKQLPPIRYMLSLANDTEFPAALRDIMKVANRWGFPKTVIDFLNLFDANLTFENRLDFVDRCKELELLIDQERSMPKETLRSP